MSDWNFDQQPTLICHFSDIHIGAENPKSIKRFNSTLSYAEKFHPDVLVITGDIADNCGTGSRPRYCDQNQPDYEVYHKTLQNHLPSFKTIIEIAGNHDIFGVYNFSSKSHFFKQYSFTQYNNFSNYHLSSRKINNLTFILMNPFKFPAAHPAFMFWAHPTKKFLDKFESTINSSDPHENIILASHYPISMYGNEKSSSGHSIHEIVSYSDSISLILTGHTHRFTPLLHKGTLEVIGIKGHGFGLLINDNNRLSYHNLIPEKNVQYRSKNTLNFAARIKEYFSEGNENTFQGPPKPLVTFPIPEKLISSRSDFNSTKIPIRVLSFTEKNLSISVRIDNGSLIHLNHTTKFSSGLRMYSIKQVKLPKGKHHIEFIGDLNESFNFIINDTYLPTKIQKRGYNEVKYPLIVIVFAFSLLEFLFLFLTFPCDCFTIDSLDIKYYVQSLINALLFGPLIQRNQLRKLSNRTRILLFFEVIYPLFFPISIMKIEDHFGFIWLYGYFCDNYFLYAEWGMIYCLLYFAMVILPTLTLALYITSYSHFAFILLFVVVFGIAFNIFGLFRWLVESAGWYGMTSPMFVILPIIIYIFLIIEKLNS